MTFRQYTLAGILFSYTLLACAQESALKEDPPPKTQRYRYDPESSYLIIGSPGVPTDIELMSEEHVTGFALGDTLQWVIEELPGHVFVKPMKADISTAGTLVTDRHTYQLTFRSAHPKEVWMQRVLWSYPDLVIFRSLESKLPHGAERVPTSMPVESAKTPNSPPGDPSTWNFQYEVRGEASFKPTIVVDDHHSIWIQLRSKETMPAVFEGAQEGQKVLNYSLRGDWILIPKLVNDITLKLGRQEIHIHRVGP